MTTVKLDTNTMNQQRESVDGEPARKKGKAAAEGGSLMTLAHKFLEIASAPPEVTKADLDAVQEKMTEKMTAAVTAATADLKTEVAANNSKIDQLLALMQARN